MQFEAVCCDWMSFRHEYVNAVPERESGRILKITAGGEIEWEAQQFEQIVCKSSDTSLRIKCDGRVLKGMGNIGRFQRPDNKQGLTVSQCVERWGDVAGKCGFHTGGFGRRLKHSVMDSKLFDAGTFLTRLDLAGNMEVSDYSSLCSAAMIRRVGQKLPVAGLYGPTWGYQSKRSNWWKAKLYDKTAELEGRRRSSGGATLARFEVQLGSEWLKREEMDRPDAWKDDEMAQIIYGRFAEPVFRDSVSVTDWCEIPTRLRAYAVLWRDGVDVRTVLKQTQYYETRKKLMAYGIDIGTSCNVLSLARHTRIVEVLPVSALRDAA